MSVEIIEPDERLATKEITPELLSYIVEKIVRAVQPQKIILFGSRARGDVAPGSDLDLFIVYDGEEATRTIRRKIDRLLYGRDFDVDILVRSPREVRLNLEDGNPFYVHHVFKYGRVLYERG